MWCQVTRPDTYPGLWRSWSPKEQFSPLTRQMSRVWAALLCAPEAWFNRKSLTFFSFFSFFFFFNTRRQPLSAAPQATISGRNLLQRYFYIPVDFPESLGCHDLKPVRPDLHPHDSRIRPMCSLCALPTERTAFSLYSLRPVALTHT